MNADEKDLVAKEIRGFRETYKVFCFFLFDIALEFRSEI